MSISLSGLDIPGLIYFPEVSLSLMQCRHSPWGRGGQRWCDGSDLVILAKLLHFPKCPNPSRWKDFSGLENINRWAHSRYFFCLVSPPEPGAFPGSDTLVQEWYTAENVLDAPDRAQVFICRIPNLG